LGAHIGAWRNGPRWGEHRSALDCGRQLACASALCLPAWFAGVRVTGPRHPAALRGGAGGPEGLGGEIRHGCPGARSPPDGRTLSSVKNV
jgi:hypothetical protein